jgi:hypothetical protein
VREGNTSLSNTKAPLLPRAHLKLQRKNINRAHTNNILCHNLNWRLIQKTVDARLIILCFAELQTRA